QRQTETEAQHPEPEPTETHNSDPSQLTKSAETHFSVAQAQPSGSPSGSTSSGAWLCGRASHPSPRFMSVNRHPSASRGRLPARRRQLLRARAGSRRGNVRNGSPSGSPLGSSGAHDSAHGHESTQ